MSKLAELYQQADAVVLKRYQEEPEDHWKFNAIQEHRAGIRDHDSVMKAFVEDVEKVIDDISKPHVVLEVAATTIPQSIKPATAPNNN